jgi:hypothetical protein
MTARNYEGLLRYLAQRSRTPFAWGRDANDCVSHMLGALEAQGTPLDPATLPAWSSERGAARVLARLGGLEAALGGWLRPIAPAMAQRGDIAGVIGPDGTMAVLIVEGDTLVGPSPAGHQRLARSRMVRAWSAT